MSLVFSLSVVDNKLGHSCTRIRNRLEDDYNFTCEGLKKALEER